MFNNVVLHPVKKANITYRYKLEQFERDLKEKMDAIPKDKFVEPPLRITGPTLEALKYTFDTKEIRELYLELLASAMNMDKVNDTHASFVDIIKVLSPTDAYIFNRVTEHGGQVASGRISIGYDNSVFTHGMPSFYTPVLNEGINPFEASKSLQNLIRLGLITHLDNGISGYNYEEYKTHHFVESRLKEYKTMMPDKEMVIKVNGEVVILNDFGWAFKKVCLPH
ncbi:DUF4393 domain-containing protein [Aliivibrio fischeri]|uniref:DUF4393 domain-containing protein n=1 Tax=Aliivibrio fischeri TaxID=668 RepID=UPI00105FF271|nr:DUF4393 domain-containing protein [Aliivibrio fischeri]TDM51415.1 DUF4393 domain-containing protein [Aliivibrio fischeri]